jgi:hypothetical protein
MSNPALRDAVFNAIVFAGLIGCLAGMAIMALARLLFFRGEREEDGR